MPYIFKISKLIIFERRYPLTADFFLLVCLFVCLFFGVFWGEGVLGGGEGGLKLTSIVII